MKTILFPTDFSKISTNALDFAASIAQLFGAKLLLVYAVRSFADRDKFITSAAFDNETEAENALKKLANHLPASISCEYLVKTGAVSDEIASVAKERQADLIIMGTAGAGDVPDTLALLNSTTTELIEKRVCPLLAIPLTAKIKPIKKVVLAVDKESLDSDVLRSLVVLVKAAKAEIFLLTISDTDSPELLPSYQIIEKAFTGLTFSVHAVKNEDVIESIQKFSHKQEVDILTVIARKRGFFDLLFHDSVSQKLALHSKIPLLVLPE